MSHAITKAAWRKAFGSVYTRAKSTKIKGEKIR